MTCLYMVKTFVCGNNWRINNQFVGPSEMTFRQTKGRKLCNVITHNIIWANQMTEHFVFCGYAHIQCLTLHAFQAFVGAWDVI